MCGFSGVFTNRRVTESDLSAEAREMVSAVAHRGPDDDGVWADGGAGIAFGFRRLAIIDLSEGGHQPMSSPSGRYTAVFNGEIYNHEELRSELLRGRRIRLRGRSDTEVALAAFDIWGIEAAVRTFVGMFAIAVWDSAEARLHLIRDRVGIKPLFVFTRPGTILFGSELKSLMAHPLFERVIDSNALASYFCHLYIPAPRTIFRDATKLLPGRILTFPDPDPEQATVTQYWSMREVARTPMQAAAESISASSTPPPRHEMVDELESSLRRAVKLRMRSDVPLGALLSGGIDSSLVTAFMQEVSSRPVRTFSIGFDDPRFDESCHAAAVARHLGTEHTEMVVSGDAALDQVPRIAEIFDEPFADPSQLPSFLVCQMARHDVTVAMAGDGGDEVFAGYNRYVYGRRALGLAGRIPRWLSHVIGDSVQRVSVERWDRLYGDLRKLLPRAAGERLVGDKVHKFGAMLNESSMSARYRSLIAAWPDGDALVKNGVAYHDAIDEVFADDEFRGLLNKMLLADQLGYLPDDLLAKVDRVSMAVGLEVRVPMLDHRVIEFAWRIPDECKVRSGKGKFLLRELLQRRLPRHLFDRPKMGFSVPIDSWLRNDLRDWADDLLQTESLEESGLLVCAPIRKAWEDFLVGNTRLGPGIWTVLMFAAWRRQWLPDLSQGIESPNSLDNPVGAYC